MDFSKAFDKVPLCRLNHKLHWYGIRGTTLQWITAFLTDRAQRVVLEGAASGPSSVISGVPQGTVLGPILFLLYINDLPDGVVNSTARLFADYCIVYRSIRNVHDAILLQNDLNSIAEWELTWEMKLNIDKCFIMRSSRARQKIIHQYTLHDQPLVETETAKYPGITLTPDLKWNKHINNIINKANRNIITHSQNTCLPSSGPTTHGVCFLCMGPSYPV